jgi:hypothetical protein
MTGWLHYLELQAKVRLGLNRQVLIWAAIAGLCVVISFVFLLVSLTIWLADRYGPLTATLILGAAFIVMTFIALFAALNEHRQTILRAKQALAVRSNTPWFNPQNVAVGLKIGRAIGWRRLVPLIAVGALAAGLAKEWYGHSNRDESASGESDVS